MNCQHNHTFIGIDISKNAFDYADSIAMKPKRCTYDEDGVNHAVEQFTLLAPKLIVMEATGGLERRLAHRLMKEGFDVVVANPRYIRSFAVGMKQLAKTDKLDAKIITKYAKTAELEPDTLPTPYEIRLQALVTRRLQLVEMRTAESNRMARTEDVEMCQSVQDMLDMIDKQISGIEASMKKIMEKAEGVRERVALLKSMKGVGPVTSGVLVTMLPELGRVNGKEIAKLVGVAPINNESGESWKKMRTLGGRKRVRTALYMAALSAIRWNSAIRIFYERLRAAGKSKMTALVASMRKMLTILNAMIKHNQPWRDTVNP